MSRDTLDADPGKLPNSELPLVSFVIETVNEATEPDIDLGRVLGGIARQTYPRERIEILIVVDDDNQSMLETIRRDFPEVKTLIVKDSSYFSMKREGTYATKGDVIALLDSDCDPSPVWVQRAVERIQDGADVVAGKTRYPKSARYSTTFSFFNFGYVKDDGTGSATGFLPNNVVFRAEVLRQHNFDPRIRRGGAGHFLGRKLRSLSYSIVYEPEVQATHNMYGLEDEMQMRIKAGFDSVNLARMDEDLVIEDSKILKQTGPLGLIQIFVGRVVFDLKSALTNRRDLDLRWHHIPYFFVVSPMIRGVEFGAAAITFFCPNYLKDKYGW